MIDEQIQNYAENYTSPESNLLERLRLRTYAERSDKSMLSGFYQGRLLAMLSKMLGPRRILEIGTYMGYSALCLAEGLTPDGKVITLDVDAETNAIAREVWEQTELGEKIESHLGNAAELIPTLDETFDLVFIDADKENYFHYYELVFPKVRTGGYIIADNVLWGGQVIHVEKGWTMDENTTALHDFNQKIQADERVTNIIFAVRDGLMIVRKDSD